ncbi:MAG TPA: hypothetical protein VM888_05320, partial [Chitinophagaceae bacterium]|nr:hypothetical protein [Chitinophagaceae bacterium]
MTTNKTLIVYIAYGPDHLHKQVIFSILTLYYFLNIKGEFEKINLIVFTDKKEAFEKSLNGISIIYEILTPQEIKEYIGIREFKHIHRLKIFVLKHCFQKYKSNLLYIDGDTYFLKSPVELINKISNNTSIFHAKEFELSKESEYGGGKSLKLGYDPIKLLSSVIKKINCELHEKDYKLDMNVEMWNAGVLGISFNNHSLLDDVLKLTDRISKKTSYFLAEQFAFSYILFKKTALMPAYEFIYHYWPEDSKEVYS